MNRADDKNDWRRKIVPVFPHEFQWLFPAFGSSHSQSLWSSWRDCQAILTCLMKLNITWYFNKKIGPVFKADIGGRAEELEGWVVGFEGLSLPHFVQILPQVAGKVDYESIICKAKDHKSFLFTSSWRQRSQLGACTPWTACAAPPGSHSSCLRVSLDR